MIGRVAAIRSARAALRDRRGSSTIEFAFWASSIFIALVPSLDFAAYLILSSRLGAAVQQASVVAYNARDSDPLATGNLASYVAATAAMPQAPTTTITCNGTQQCATNKSARQCVCVGMTGAAPTYSASGSCGATCPSGATSGYYLRISSTYTYNPMIVPTRWLNNSAMTQAVTVRLQ